MPLIVLLLASCLSPLAGAVHTHRAAPAVSAQAKAAQSQVHQFESPDHSIALRYSSPVVLCQQGNKPGCRLDILNLCSPDEDGATVIACFAYAGKTYERYNFRSAVLSLATLGNAKDQAACLNLPGTKRASEQFNGISFASSQDSEGAAGTLVDHRYYRTFRGGRCYLAELSIATANYGAMDPGTTKEFKASDFDKVYGTLKQVLNTLHFASADK